MAKNSIIVEIATEEILEANSVALESVSYYKKVKDLIEETYLALGKKQTFQAINASTANFEINYYAANPSTTAQKI